MKRLFVVLGLMLAVGCASSSGKQTPKQGKDAAEVVQDSGQDTDGIKSDGTTTDPGQSGGKDVQTDPGQKDVPSDRGNGDTTSPFDANGMNCTLSPDNQTGYKYTCDQICQKLHQCNSEDNQADCMQHCEAFRIEARVDVVNAFAKCILNTACGNGDLVETCNSVIEDYVSKHAVDLTQEQKQACKELGDAFRGCGEFDEDQVNDIMDNCTIMQVVLRKEANQRVTACKDSTCSAIDECYTKALCLDMWSLPGASPSEGQQAEMPNTADEPFQHDAYEATTMPDTHMGDINVNLDTHMGEINNLDGGGIVLDSGNNPDNGPMNDANQGKDVITLPCKQYSTQTGFTIDLNTVCDKRHQCDPNLDKDQCVGFLTQVKLYVNVQKFNAIGECIKNHPCSDVTENDKGEKDILDWCLQQTLGAPDESTVQKCEAFKNKAVQCNWDEEGISNIQDNCMRTHMVMRDEVIANFDACLNEDCDLFGPCMNSSACLEGPND